MGSHRRPPLPRVFVTHYLAIAKRLGPNMQEITWELYLARWARILIWLEAEADWINLEERQSVWGPGGTFSPKFPEVLWRPWGFCCGPAWGPSRGRLKEWGFMGSWCCMCCNKAQGSCPPLPHSEDRGSVSESSWGTTAWTPSFCGGPETAISAGSSA